MCFASKLKKLRKEKGLSQEQLAMLLTISRQDVSKWELGESMPDTENIVQIGELFKVTIDYLLKDNLEHGSNVSDIDNKVNIVKMSQRVKIIKLITILLIGFSLLGILTMWVLSFIVTSYKWTTGTNSPPVPIPYEEAQDNFYPQIVVKGDFPAFLQTHGVEGLFFVIIFILVISITLLIIFSIEKRT